MLPKPWACGDGKCPPAMFLASERSSYLVMETRGQTELKNNEISVRACSQVGTGWAGEIQI